MQHIELHTNTLFESTDFLLHLTKKELIELFRIVAFYHDVTKQFKTGELDSTKHFSGPLYRTLRNEVTKLDKNKPAFMYEACKNTIDEYNQNSKR